MDGDITRSTFDPDKAYSSVRLQQGRVQIDADWNEQRDIELHDERQLRTDVVGPHGAPIGNPGMLVTATGSGLQVRPGRYYVHGIRVDNPVRLDLDGLPEGDGRYVVYLDVWERAITAVEDPTIREVALGGPDTATRTKVTWRVRALKVTTTDPTPGCTTAFQEWTDRVTGNSGTLQVQAEAAETTTDPCLVPEAAGYRGLDNRTYRVQIHSGSIDPETGLPQTPTFKWSRDNGAVLASWVAAPTDAPSGGVEVQVERLGPGGTNGFTRGGWVELSNDRHDVDERPGVMAEVADLSESTLTLEHTQSLAEELGRAYNDQAHPKVRAWDSAGALDLSADEWVELERGLQVKFNSGTWRSGDLWVIPARTAILPGSRNRQIEWPVDEDRDPVKLPPQRPRHHYAPLAMAKLDGETWTVTRDCRERFGSLVDAVQFDARGGEGQHAPSGHWLPAPLLAGVSLGTHPLADARVRFRVTAGGGKVAAVAPDESGVPDDEDDVVLVTTVTTEADGLARAWWQLGQAVPPEKAADTYQPQAAQEVVAELLDADGNVVHQPLRFTANAADPIVLVDAGGNGQLGLPGETLEVPLRARVSAGTQPAEGQQVSFEIQSRMLDGAALDELRGGSLQASVNPVEADPWPDGERTVRAVVATDASGIAQVQWVLGIEEDLPVQQVTATLLDAADDPTSQQVLYSAHLAVAGEIGWAPCAPLAGASPGASVQGALDLFCQLLGALGATGTVTGKGATAAPMATPLVPDSVVSLADWQGVEIATGLLLRANPSKEALASALVVTAEIPLTDAPGGKVIGHTIVRVMGTAEVNRGSTGTVVSWSAANADQLLEEHAKAGEVRVYVTLFPGLLVTEAPIAVPWYGAFRITA